MMREPKRETNEDFDEEKLFREAAGPYVADELEEK
jgi:hypothetical protein